MAEQVAPARIVEQAQQGGVLVKLFVFSLSLAVVPISSYFISEKYVWGGNSTLAALTAVVFANMVLAGYIIMSMREEKKFNGTTGQPESKKNK